MTGATVALSDAAAHHARVKRLGPGDVLRLTDGAGTVSQATIAALHRDSLSVTVADVVTVGPQPAVHLRAPVADRDRMLWLAEKATELGVTSWQAVRFKRSASVSPRGEGSAFGAKLRARMISALEQSGGAWLPLTLPDTTPDSLVINQGELPILLDHDGQSLSRIVSLPSAGSPVLLLGPEGGLEPAEVAALGRAGWQLASLADTTLRFETAGIAAVAVCRALKVSRGS
ncbi:MAG: RsmE family RNA methyltransferase [Gemmatimonadaceae bacterium]